MIAKARCISHGGNALRYSTRKVDAEIVKIHNLPEGLSATTLYAMMHATQLRFRENLNRHRHLEKTSIQIEVSPSEEETVGWT
ncbi:MAG: relaxase, partial [Candidatus Cryptobacteroides sp.]|nr:relaxase [Candidatus Cryptobacteroides sp.]